jgi:glycosyltransferase involved in cell wall biosynthesis
MKILYLAPYADGTGYSNAAIETMLTLDSIGANVVTRSIKMTNSSGEVPERVRGFASKDLTNIDLVIQHNLPDEFVNTRIKNIGVFAYETDSLINTGWIDVLKRMNKVIVATNFEREVLATHSVNAVTIPFATDINKYNDLYEPLDFNTPDNCLRFYTISEFTDRKNIQALLASYFKAFSYSDAVILVVKTNVSQDRFQSLVTKAKKSCRRFVNDNMYPRVVLINDRLSNADIGSLHASCDVFVTMSRGESSCLPCIDALGFGRYVITPDSTGFKDYVTSDKIGQLVSTTRQSITSGSNAPSNLYTTDEQWFNPSSDSMRDMMRWTQENISVIQKHTNDRKDMVRDTFSYKTVGKQWKDLLSAI